MGDGAWPGDDDHRRAFDLATVGMAITDLDGRFLSVNRSLCRLLGRTEADLLNRTVAEISELAPTASGPTSLLTDSGDGAAVQVERRYGGAGRPAVWGRTTSRLLPGEAGHGRPGAGRGGGCDRGPHDRRAPPEPGSGPAGHGPHRPGGPRRCGGAVGGRVRRLLRHRCAGPAVAAVLHLSRGDGGAGRRPGGPLPGPARAGVAGGAGGPARRCHHRARRPPAGDGPGDDGPGDDGPGDDGPAVRSYLAVPVRSGSGT